MRLKHGCRTCPAALDVAFNGRSVAGWMHYLKARWRFRLSGHRATKHHH